MHFGITQDLNGFHGQVLQAGWRKNKKHKAWPSLGKQARPQTPQCVIYSKKVLYGVWGVWGGEDPPTRIEGRAHLHVHVLARNQFPFPCIFFKLSMRASDAKLPREFQDIFHIFYLSIWLFSIRLVQFFPLFLHVNLQVVVKGSLMALKR